MRTRLFRAAEVEGRLVDVVIRDGRIDSVLECGSSPTGVDEVIDADGGALIPGLHDHHVHLHAMVARIGAVDLDALDSADAVDSAIAACVGARTVDASDAGGGIRIGGFDEHRHGPMDRHRLDRCGMGRAVRVQHRSGLSWVLSTRALSLLPAEVAVERDPSGEATGWVHRHDRWPNGEAGDRSPSAGIGADGAGFAELGRRLAAMGITGVTDATFQLGDHRAEALRRAVTSGDLPQRLMLLGVDEPCSWAAIGARKMLVDEYRGVDPDALTDAIRASHAQGRPVALHAVTRAECVVAVRAVLDAGAIPGDRIEHGSVMPTDLDGPMAIAELTVVVQPMLVLERGDHHLVTVDPEDRPLLHRAGSLLAAGVRVTVGSDAPVTSFDPWATIAAARDRRTRDGRLVGPAERVHARTALGWYLADPHRPGDTVRRVVPGAAADLCLLDRPLASALSQPTATQVRATFVDGRLVGP